jgi:hypothetical protein
MIGNPDQDGIEQPALAVVRQAALVKKKDRVGKTQLHQRSDIVPANPQARRV